MPWKRLGFQPGLEGLRGVAVVAVVALHIGGFLVPGISGWFVRGGFLGVDVFFALSGFLITSILITGLGRRGRLGYGRFVLRRIQRLYPAIVLFCVVQVLYALAIGAPLGNSPGGGQGVLANLAWLATYTTNLEPSLGVQPRLDMVHLWTLGVEMQFYLVWPLVFWALTRVITRTRRLVAAIAILGALSAGTRAVEWTMWKAAPFWPHVVYQRTEARVDAILCGAIVAVLWSRDVLTPRVVRVAGVAGAIVLVVGFLMARQDARWMFLGGYAVAGVAASAVIADVVVGGSPLGRLLAWAPLRVLGRVSYSLYLWHLPVIGWTIRYFGDLPPLALVAVALMWMTVTTTIAWWIAERPVLRLPALGAS